MDTDTMTDAAAAVDRAQMRVRLAEGELATAREQLEDTMLNLWDGGDGLSYRELGQLAGFGKAHIGNMIHAARERRS